MKFVKEDAQKYLPGTLMETLEMELVKVDPDEMILRMPVTDKVKQPARLLHGGATAAMVETVASFGSAIQCPKGFIPVGIEVNCNHLRAKDSGYIEAVGVPVHRGRRTHVWDVKVYDEEKKMIAIGRCTVAITPIES
jgi:uncharacterized protein (TIGR00369 family)